MKPYSLRTIISIAFYMILASCGNNRQAGDQTSADSSKSQSVDTTHSAVLSIKTEVVSYTSNGNQSRGYVAYDENRQGKLPVVVIIPEWWGLVDYAKSRARQLAELDRKSTRL